MSNETTPGFAGKQYKVIPPRKPEVSVPGNEGTPTIPVHSPVKQFPVSAGRGDLLPTFSRFSRSLDQQLDMDQMIRESAVRGPLNIKDAELAPAQLRAQLADAVQKKEITEQDALALWNTAFPGQDPGAR